MSQTENLSVIRRISNRGIWFNSSVVIASYAVSTEDCSVSQEKWQEEIQPDVREKSLNPTVISTFLRVFLLYNAKNIITNVGVRPPFRNRIKCKTGTSSTYKVVAWDHTRQFGLHPRQPSFSLN